MLKTIVRHSTLRLVFMLVILTLIPITVSCGSGSTPVPTPTPPWYENPSEPQLPEAESLCEAAFSASQSDGPPVAPVLTLINIEYEEGKWTHGPKIRPIEAPSAAEVQTLVCIMESRDQVGSYTSSGAYDLGAYTGGGGAYRLVWDVRLVRLSDGKVLGANQFAGSDPPESIIVSMGESGEGYGEPPTSSAFNWVLPILGNRTILHAGRSVSSVAFSPDGQLLALGSEMVKLWDVSTSQEEVRTFPEQVGAVIIEDGEEVPIFMPADPTDYKAGNVQDVAFSPDGQFLASGTSDATVKLWDVATGREIRTFSGHNYIVESIAFVPDGTMLASASADATVKLWDVETGREIRTLNRYNSLVGSVAFAPDGTTLASGSCMQFQEDNVKGVLFQDKCTKGEVRLWQVSDGTLLHTLEGHKDFVSSVAFAPDGQTLASGSWDKTVKLWDVAVGRMVSTVEGHTGQVMSVAFSPDGTTLASAGCMHDMFESAGRGCSAGEVRLWQVSDGTLLHTLEGHTGLMRSVAFSPDGQTLASAGGDGWVKLWDVATGQ